MSPHAAEDAAPLQAGDLVLLDFELWAEGSPKPELIDTTREEVAQRANVPLGETAAIRPRPHLVGGDGFPSGIENALIGAKVGAEFEKEFAPAEAFGERDPKLIELFSMHEIERLPEMRREDAELGLGTILTIKGRRGRVITLTAARVRVDFNPAFAGRKVRARILPMHRISEPAEKVRAVLDMTYGHGPEFEVKFHQGIVTIHVPERAKFDLRWMIAKPRAVDQVRAQLKPKSIHIVEEFVAPTASAAGSEAGKGGDTAKPVPAEKGSESPREPAVPS